MRRSAVIPGRVSLRKGSLVALAVVLLSPPPIHGGKADELPKRYRQWLEEVALLIDKGERKAFLALEDDYQRDAFIESFWKARDRDPETERNGFRDAWYSRLEHAREEYGNWTEDRAVVFLLNGPPALREEIECGRILHPVEVWHYPWSDRAKREVRLLFYHPYSLPPPRLWAPSDGYLVLFAERKEALEKRCSREAVREIPRLALRRKNRVDDLSFECAMTLLIDHCGYGRDLVKNAIVELEMEEEVAGNVETLLARLQSRPDPEQEEWLATFATHSTEVPAGAGRLDGEVAVRFPGRHQSRTVVDVELRVPREQAAPAELGEHSSYDFVVTGEVLRRGELFESFRYGFSFPAAEAPETLPLVVRRYLRPGEYRLVLKVEDVHGRRFLRREEPVTVPEAPPPGAAGSGGDEAWALEAREALGAGETRRASVELPRPEPGVLMGYVRFDAVVRGDGVEEVTFSLDGRPVLTRRRPPYTVELDLGEAPRPHTVRVTAYDAEGGEMAADELEINAGEHSFGVKIVEPRPGSSVRGIVPVRAEVQVPDGAALDRLELYRGDRLAATLHQAPFEQPIPAPSGPGFLRAVAYLTNGHSTEHTVLVNAEGPLDEIDVELVELYATVLDPNGRPVTGLSAEDFRVREDGSPQEIVRFEPVSDRPVHLAVVVDASASMEDHLPRVRKAAVGFLESFLGPRDRAALVAFNDRPRLLEKLTGDVRALAQELAGFSAEGNTALWDSVVFALHHLAGIRGQRALLVLTDGKDETSGFDFDQALTYARAMGTTIYAVGIGTDVRTRRHLAKLAGESGGRSFEIDSSRELDGIYATIARELRAGYLIVYQSSRTDGDRSFRRVETDVTRPGLTVRALRGYYP